MNRFLINNAAVALFGRGVGLTLSFFYTVLLARALTPKLFGEFTFVFALAAVAAAVADLGLWSIFTRAFAHTSDEELGLARSAFWLRFLVLAGLSFLVLVSVPFFPKPFGSAFLVAFWSVALLRMFELLVGCLQVRGRMQWAAVGEISGRGVQLLSLWLLLKLGAPSFLFIVATQLLGSLLQVFVVIMGNRLIVSELIPPTLAAWRKIVAAGMNLGGASVLQNFYFRSSLLSLKFFSNQLELGAFSLPFRFLEMAVFVPGTFSGLLLPDFSRSYFANKKQPPSLNKRTILFMFWLGLATSAAFFFLAPPFIKILGGAKWGPGAAIAQILSAALFFIFFGSVFGVFITALREEKLLLKASFYASVLSVLFSVVFVWRWQALGAAAALAATEFCAALFLGLAVLRLKRKRPELAVPLVKEN